MESAHKTTINKIVHLAESSSPLNFIIREKHKQVVYMGDFELKAILFISPEHESALSVDLGSCP